MPRNDWRRLAVVLLLAAPAVAGCGKRDGNKVSGKVSYDGKPLTSGTVVFFDVRGNTLRTAIGRDGSYRVTGAAKGEAKIAVVGHARSPTFRFVVNSPPAPPRGRDSQPSLPRPPTLPARYGHPDQSDLTCQVTGSDQTHDIELKP